MKNVEKLLSDAMQFEEQSHALESALKARYPLIARLIKLSQEEAGKQLLEFVLSYIRLVPELFDEFLTTAEQLNLSRSAQPLTSLANNFLNFAPEDLGIRAGVTALMIKAYLVNRLLEEISDACFHRIGKTLIPMDLTMTNTIIHTIIGEPFANDLDQLVVEAVDSLLSQQAEASETFMEQITDSNLVHIWQRLPSLTNQLGLPVNLPS